MSYQSFYKDDAGFRNWIAQNPFGFIINSSPGSGSPPKPRLNPNYLVGHRPHCLSFQNNPTNYSKHCFSSTKEAISYINLHYPDSRLRTECTDCKPNLTILSTNTDDLLNKAFQLSDEIKLSGPPPGNKTPVTSIVQTSQYYRDPLVASYVLKASQNSCEICKTPAPFITKAGRPYLEIHHIRYLANDGSDTINNTVALCPNCHREIHYGEQKESIIEKLYREINRLTLE